MKSLKLGTRRSLLAWAQSSWVAREVERLNPGARVELVGIDTRGDKIVDVSLRNVVGKEFFVAELDDALRGGQVDFTVHSMKDLSLDRPEGFALAAIPPRENARDAVLFGPGAMEKLRAGQRLRIGTSSPRRLENIPPFLERALPVVGGHRPRVELVEIRGNVNTRLGRVLEPEGSERGLDGVVLAFAGLIRLWADEAAGRAELAKLLRGVRWMILPLRECPAAPAQGALAVECRADDARAREALGRLHHAETEARVRAERQLLADWGGGCHQKFGATVSPSRELGDLMYVRGRKPDDTFVEELRWKAPSRAGGVAGTGLAATGGAWDGSAVRAASADAEANAGPGEIRSPAPSLDGSAVFVAHSRALPPGTDASGARVWTSGTSSWIRLAEQGVWVEGCAEGLGFEALEGTLREGVLQLPAFGARWIVLTHEGAREGWGDARVTATYRVAVGASASIDETALARAADIYWSSGSQFDLYGRHASKEARHACGPGKTAAHLRAKGVSPAVFPSAEEWKKWLRS